MAKDEKRAAKKRDSGAGALGAVVVRNEFYRDGYRTLLRVAIAQAVAIVILVGVTVATIAGTKPDRTYFATTQDGRLITMVPLGEPNLSDAALLSWAAQAGSETLTFGFNDYRRRLQEASRQYFTTDGWANFTKALQRSGWIDRIEANSQFLIAVPSQAPAIVQQGAVAGVYKWHVRMPMTLTFRSGNSQDTRRITVDLIIVRVPQLETPTGVGIQQWVAQ